MASTDAVLCYICNANVTNNQFHAVLYTSLSPGGAELSEILVKALLISDVTGLDESQPVVCDSCCTLFAEFSEYSEKVEKVREKLWTLYKSTVLRRNKDLGDLIRGTEIQTEICSSEIYEAVEFTPDIEEHGIKTETIETTEREKAQKKKKKKRKSSPVIMKTQEVIIYSCKVCGKELKSKAGAIYHAGIHSVQIGKFSDLLKVFNFNNEGGNEPERDSSSPADFGFPDAASSSSSSDDEIPLGKRWTPSSSDKSKNNGPSPRGRGRPRKIKKEGEEDGEKPVKEKTFPCSFCDKLCKTKAEQKSHLQSHSDERPFICEICGQSYKRKPPLDVHVNMHMGIFKYQCSYCQKAFTQKSALRRHLPIHTGDLPFQCELCGQRFVHRMSLQFHKMAHTGIRTIRCEICDKGFLSKPHLRRHMRVHSGEKAFACGTCGRTFAEKYNLMSHQRIHNPVKAQEKKPQQKKRPMSCTICDVVFYKKVHLEDHMRGEHHNPSGNLQIVEPRIKRYLNFGTSFYAN